MAWKYRYGNRFDNEIRLSNDVDELVFAKRGNDLITELTSLGPASNDVMYGGRGNDTFLQYSGNDSLFGERGNDTFEIHGSDDVIINGGRGHDVVKFFEWHSSDPQTVEQLDGSTVVMHFIGFDITLKNVEEFQY